MTTTALTQGAEWSADTLHDGWGDNITDEQVSELGRLVVSRFEELALADGYAVHWFPELAEVHGDVELDVYDDTGECWLPYIRDTATADVWNAVIGNGGPMVEAVNEIFQEVAN